MVYVLGVSTGAFGVTGPEEKAQLAGLFRKAQAGITKGVNFVQLDLESISEFYDPDLPKKMEEDIIKKLGINFGIHSETKAFGVEAAELDSAVTMEYERAHKRIIEILKRAREIKAKYVLIHSSESEPFLLLDRTLQSTDLVDPDGGKLSDFLNNNPQIIDWIFGGKIDDIVNCVMNLWRSTDVGGRREILLDPKIIQKTLGDRGIVPRDFIFIELFRGAALSDTIRRVMENVITNYEAPKVKYEDLDEEGRRRVDDAIERNLKSYLNNHREEIIMTVQSRSLTYGSEKLAYYLVAKWMEERREPLWGSIVSASMRFFAKREGKTVEEWTGKQGIKKLSIDDNAFRERHEIWVPAVSARYIYGHFFPKDKRKYEDPKQYLDEKEMIFAFESPMGGRGIEEWLRLGNPALYYYLVEEANKQAGRDIFAVAMDFEHMLSLRIDPEMTIDLLPENGGRYVRIIHAGWPSTLAPAHLPIEIGSTQQKYLYDMYYKLRQKGFGKDEKESYIIFERGGPETFQQSVIALKIIVDFLQRDIEPDEIKNHPEKYKDFWGIDITQIAAIERQRVSIQEHAFDPLKGLITVPEEEHGFFGRAAVEKGKAEEWRKEKYR